MATFKIVLDKRKKLEKDKFHLSVRVSNSRDITYLHLSQLMTLKEYDIYFRKQVFDKNILAVKEKFESYANRAHMVYQIVVPYDKAKFREIFYDKEFDFDKDTTQAQKIQSSIKFLFEKCTKEKLESNQIKSSTADNYRTALNNLEKFQKNMTYHDITGDMLFKIESWYLSNKIDYKNNSIASVGNLMRSLKAVLNYNIKKKIIPKSYEYPFNEYKIPSYIPPKKVISMEEIQKIIDLNEFNNWWEEYARDIWILLYRMHGINYIDLLLLKWENQIGEHFVFMREKTRTTRRNNIRPIKVKISDKIQSVLNKVGNKNSRYVLGKIKKEGYSQTYLKNLNRSEKSEINKYLNIIGKRLNLSATLNIALARVCYANSLKRNNVNPLKISENMNHSDPRTTTLHYLDQFEQTDLDDVDEFIL
jgi:hypothetical protein